LARCRSNIRVVPAKAGTHYPRGIMLRDQGNSVSS